MMGVINELFKNKHCKKIFISNHGNDIKLKTFSMAQFRWKIQVQYTQAPHIASKHVLWFSP